MFGLAPGIAGWHGFSRVFTNLAAFGLTVVAAVWIVHQTEYRIEYGSRFGAVMQASPHHLYMIPAGLGLALTAVIALLLSGWSLHRSRHVRRASVRFLPHRLSRRVHMELRWPGARAVISTAALLALCQIVLYSLQENVESVTFLGTLPGLQVLIAPRHLTVIPLHLVAALVGSLLLWLTAAIFHRDRSATQLARVLADIIARRASPTRSAPPAATVFPHVLTSAGIRSPRAPPNVA